MKDNLRNLLEIIDRNATDHNIRDFVETSSEEDLSKIFKHIILEKQDLENQLGAYKNIVDTMFNSIIQLVQSKIMDFSTSMQAVNFYDVKWFAGFPLSEKLKIELACALIQSTQKYLNEENIPDFWKKLSISNSKTIQSIKFTEEYDDEE